MPTKNPFSLRENIFLLIHGGSGDPFAVRVNVYQLFWLVFSICLIFTTTILGSLLFFRELELNRKLTDRVLELENEVTLTRLSTAARFTAISSPVTVTSVEKIPPAVKAAAEAQPVATPAAIPTAPPITTVQAAPVRPRVGDMTVDCAEGSCTVRLGMIPTGTGTAQGQLLGVLETELPRIGVGNPSNPVRKRYFLYPGETFQDDLDLNEVSQLERKNFRFSRALQTVLNFKIERTLRPIAAHVYLFDAEGNLLHHEQKPVKTDE